MKKVLTAFFLILSLNCITLAQAKQQEFRLLLGDTLVWQPFAECNAISYSIKGPKIITFKPLHYGEKIQIIASRVGESSILATCNDNDNKAMVNVNVVDPNEVHIIAEKPVKPATKTFTATYKFTPPANHFFVTIHNEETRFNETYMKLDENEAYNDGLGLDRFWNVKTGKNWYYRPEAQGWTDDVDWEFEPIGTSFPILNAFANEVDKSDLSNYYVGNETIVGIECWKFFVDYEDGTVIQYWVDPANGCTLKRQINANPAKVVTVYDLKYTKLYFGPSFKKGLHDTTR